MAGNLDKVQYVAHALGELNKQVVFVGGSVADFRRLAHECSENL